MAKMFYSLEEAAERLGKSTDQVREMASKGQLQEFRDRDRLMFKCEQVNLLAGGGEDDVIPLADSGELEPLSLGGGGSDKDKDSTGISIFEADATDESDANAVTRVTNSPGSLMDPGDKSSTGSGGLLDLTREGDDTSLGANLLEDVYGADTVANQTAAQTAVGGDQLFESAPGAEASEGFAGGGGAPAMVLAEAYDGTWSGIGGGLALAAALCLAFTIALVIISFIMPSGGMISSLGDSFMVMAGGMLGLLVLGGVGGLLLGRRS
ncbi:MAG: hypothetical protein ACOYN0_13620 [Phycisphaerales bacterium]